MTDQTPVVSVIIPVRDQAETLQTLLAGLRSEAPASVPYEVLVVDDGSRTDLSELCARHGANHIRIDQSRGPAAARNLGAASAGGSVLFFIDADVEYTSGAVETALDVLESHPEAASVSFLSQSYREGDSTVRNYQAAIEHYWFLAYFEHPDDPVATCQGFTTRNGAVRREAFNAVGGFDTFFKTNAHEDYDFGKRLAAQYPTLLVRSPILYHRFPDRLARLIRNLWVRVTLFVPYYLTNKPPLDKSQVSAEEATLRTHGTIAAIGFYLAALPIAAGRTIGLAMGVLALSAYVWGMRDFLKAARQWSGRWTFVAQSFAIHWLTSVVISIGGTWAFLKHATARNLADAERNTR